MINLEDWVTIRNLKNNHNVPIRVISRQLNISRNTVKKALADDCAPHYKRKEEINFDILPFVDIIKKKLFQQKLIGSRILEDIKAMGYKGSKSAFYRFLAKLGTPAKRTFEPYETEPGEQAQFDWSPYTILINGVRTKVYVFSYILGFSRWRSYEVSLSETAASVYEALENSIIESRGVCGRIQTDNATCFITDASKSNFQWNSRWLAFCGHYNMKPTRSLPKRPWSKGKVERPFNYLEEHFIKGNEFSSFSEFISRLKEFQKTVNERVHLTTHKPPNTLYDIELNSFSKLPSTRFVDIGEEIRKVTADCLISYNGNRYSVPQVFATKEVWVKVSKGYILQIYSSQNKLIAEHNLSLEKGKMIIKKEHYNNHKVERGNWTRLTQDFLEIFPDQSWFIDKLKTQKKINPSYHLTQILELCKFYRPQDIVESFKECNIYNTYSYFFVKGYLENHGTIEKIPAEPINANILQLIPKEDIKRNLSDYNLIDYC